MKKIISLILTLALCVSLSACGSTKKSESAAVSAADGENIKQETQNSEESTTEPQNAGKVLVVYFSVTGNTKKIAENIADGLGAKLSEIVPKEPYTSADLDYNDDNSRSTLEMNDTSARPEISGTIDDFEQYYTVFIGYPIWWGQAPRIMDTFVESYDFTGKTVIPFCTSASSRIGSSADTLEELAGSGTWKKGQRFKGNESVDKVTEWAEQFN